VRVGVRDCGGCAVAVVLEWCGYSVCADVGVSAILQLWKGVSAVLQLSAGVAAVLRLWVSGLGCDGMS